MYIQTKPEKCENYFNFILKLKTIKNIEKNILMYMLMNNLINKDGKWLLVNIKDCEIANKITNYYDNILYAINNNNNNENKYDITLLNKNINIINTEDYSNLQSELKIYHHSPESISLIYINCNSYQTTKNLLDNIYNKIRDGSIIIFDKLINYSDYSMGALKAFYEFTANYDIRFEWLFINGKFDMDVNETTILTHDNKSVAVKIINNIHFNRIITNINYFSKEYDEFDWIFYTNHYPDLVQSKTKEDAYLHWKNYGLYEGRICKPEISNISTEVDNTDIGDFDWEIYLEINLDLKESGIKTKEDAYRHWKTCGINEKRLYKIDWCRYIKDYNLMSKDINTKIKAIQYWNQNGKPEIHNSLNYENELFDWQFYVNKYGDLSHINNEQLAWSHWTNFGKAEGRLSNNFNWTNYLLANPDLVKLGINIESTAIYHWLKHGKSENRKIGI